MPALSGVTGQADPSSRQVESFAPSMGAYCRILVLGSMPGRRSLAEHEYYAHPYNLFWPFMQELCRMPPGLSYPQRMHALHGAGLGLWDVLQRCEREGSLDSAIERASEVPNAVADLLHAVPTITAVAFNGATASAAFRRHVRPVIHAQRLGQLALIELPSTSPAHAAMPRTEKLRRWLALREFLPADT